MERTEAGTITGHVRIRSRRRVLLSLGDRITMDVSFGPLFLEKENIMPNSSLSRSTKR
jgi:translation initiation factor IF-1